MSEKVIRIETKYPNRLAECYSSGLSAELEDEWEDLDVGGWFDIWQRDYLGGVKRSTAHLYAEQIRLYIMPSLGAIKLRELNTPTVQKFYNALGRPHDGRPGLSPKSIKNVHGILHRALQQAQALGYLRRNPTSGCVLPRIEKKEIEPLEEPQIAAFIEMIEGHRHELLFKVALFTGMREGELLGLRWDCVDFRRGTIRIKQQLRREQRKGGTYYISSPKNGKPRTIVPAPIVMNLLKEQRHRQMELRRKAGPKWKDSGMVFTNLTGGYLSYRSVYDCFKRVMEKIGSPKTRFHDLRHTYAVSSLKAGDDIKTLQENLGHHSAAFTLDVYGHVTDYMKRESSQRMESYLKELLDL